MTMVGSETIDKATGLYDRPGWYTVDFPADFFDNVANGLYYYVIKTQRDGADTGQIVTGKIYLLR